MFSWVQFLNSPILPSTLWHWCHWHCSLLQELLKQYAPHCSPSLLYFLRGGVNRNNSLLEFSQLHIFAAKCFPHNCNSSINMYLSSDIDYCLPSLDNSTILWPCSTSLSTIACLPPSVVANMFFTLRTRTLILNVLSSSQNSKRLLITLLFHLNLHR